VKGHGNAAVRTTQNKAAEATLEKMGETSPVKKNQALLTATEIFLECLFQARGKKTDGRRLMTHHSLSVFCLSWPVSYLGSQIDHLDRGQRFLLNSLGQLKKAIPAPATILEAFDGWSGRAQKHRGADDAASHNG
jgi:hypothetical protein